MGVPRTARQPRPRRRTRPCNHAWHSRPHEQGATHGHLLSEISKPFYGDAKNYMKIFNANKDSLSDPDKIRVGQVLKIPAA